MAQTGVQLDAVLEQVAARRRLAVGLTRLLRAAWVLAAALALVVVLDAWLRLGPSMRASAAVAWLAAVVAALVGLLVASGRWRWTALREAWRLERAHHVATNPLVTAVQLRPAAVGGSVAAAVDGAEASRWTGALAARAVARGEAAAGRMDRRNADEWMRPRVEAQRLAAVAACWLAVAAVQPTLVAAGLWRLADPFGDHPPFGFTRVAVAAEPGVDEVLEGDDVAVTATLSGRPAERAWLVELDERGAAVRRTPMQRTSRGGGAEEPTQFVRVLGTLREPVTLRVEAGDGVSRQVRIEPRPRPEEPTESGQDDAAADERAESESARAEAEAQPAATGPRAALEYLRDEDPALAERVTELANEVGQLQRDARDLRRRAERALADGDADFNWDQWAAEVARIDGRVADAAAEARAVAERVRGHKPSAPGPLQQPLEELAEQVESMGLCALGACPNPGSADGEGEDAKGAGQGLRGASGRGAAMSPLSGWLATLEQVAAADALRWSDALGEHGFTVAPATQLGDEPGNAGNADRVALPLATGRSDEDAPVAGADSPEVDAVASKAPPAYRDLVRRYFTRVGAPPPSDAEAPGDPASPTRSPDAPPEVP